MRKLKYEEMQEAIASEEATLRTLRASHALSPLEDPMKIRKSRKKIARMKTVFREMALEQVFNDYMKALEKEAASDTTEQPIQEKQQENKTV